MENKYNDEQIIEALRQADANLDFEDIILSELVKENKNVKVLQKEKKHE